MAFTIQHIELIDFPQSEPATMAILSAGGFAGSREDAFWHRFLLHPTFPWFEETTTGLAIAHRLIEPGEVLRRERHTEGWMVRIVRAENGPNEPYRPPRFLRLRSAYRAWRKWALP